MKKKLIKILLYSILSALIFVLSVLAWPYYSLNTKEGFSSEYINSTVVEVFNEENADVKIDLSDIKLRLFDGSSILLLTAKKLNVKYKNIDLAILNNVRMKLSIWDMLRGSFSASHIKVDGGVVIYEMVNDNSDKINIGEITFGSVMTLLDNMQTLNSVSMTGIDVQYTIKGTPVVLIARSANFEIKRKNNEFKISYLGALQGRSNKGRIINTEMISIKSEFSNIKNNIISMVLDIEGIDRNFDLNVNANYNQEQNNITANSHINLPNENIIKYFDLLPNSLQNIDGILLDIKTVDYNIVNGGDVYVEGVVDGQNINVSLKVKPNKTIFVNVKANDITENILRKYWIDGIADSAREWVNKNIVGTYGLDINFKFNLIDNSISNEHGTLTLKDSFVDYYNGLPVAKISLANATFDDKKLDININSAVIYVNGKKVDISGATVMLEDFDAQTKLKVSMPANLSFKNIRSILSNKSVNVSLPSAEYNYITANFKGIFNLEANITKEEIDHYKLIGKAYNVKTNKFMNFTNISSNKLKVDISGNCVNVSGNVEFDKGSIGKLSYIEKKSSTLINYTGIIGKTTLPKFVDESTVRINDNIKVILKYNIDKKGNKKLFLTSKLDSVSYDINLLNWKKETTNPSAIEIDINFFANGAYIILVDLYSKSKTRLEINATLSGDNKGLKYIKTNKFIYGSGNLTFAGKRENDVFQVSIKGDGMYSDMLRKLIKSIPVGYSSQKTNIIFDIHNILSREGVFAKHIWGKINHNSKHLSLIKMRVSLDADKSRSDIYYTPKEINIYSEDIGLLYSILFGGNPVKSGSLTVLGKSDSNGVIQGVSHINDIEILDVPESTRLLKLFSIVGIFDALKTKSLTFKIIRGNFSFNKGIYRTENISAIGKTIAVSAKGYLNFIDKDLKLRGMILHNYELGNVFSNIPLFGEMIAGTDGQGLIAQKYVAEGSFEDYNVKIDNTGLLTPGILRNIFGKLFSEKENVPVISN